MDGQEGSDVSKAPAGRGRKRRSVTPLVVIALAAILVAFATRSALMDLGSRQTRFDVLPAFLSAYPLFLVLLPVTGIALLAGFFVAGQGTTRRTVGRFLLLWATTLVCVGLAEGTASLYLKWIHRFPRLPEWRSETAHPGNSTKDATLIVVGESSAEGVPYRDWQSVGKIVTWQLRELMPLRMFHVEVQARAGWTLEQMHMRLAEHDRRPDAVIIYAGHNEFASRYGMSQEVPHYLDDPLESWPRRLARSIGGHSPVCRLMEETLQRRLVSSPPLTARRRLVDAPSFSPAQLVERLDDFRRRIEAVVAHCERAGVLAVLVVPPGNDAGFEPNRSVLPPEMPRVERDAFAREVQRARSLESTDPDQSMALYQALIARQPGFAESHFRMARLLQRAGQSEAAYEHYVAARDLDGHPMRCPTAFQEIFRALAARHDAILVDGQAVMRAHGSSGQLDDGLFNDGIHPSLEGQAALAEAILAALKSRHAFGWPDEVAAPVIDLAECARHFDVHGAAWMAVCGFASGFYRITEPIRFDPSERQAKQRRYAEARRSIENGTPPSEIKVPGIGVPSMDRRIGSR